MRKPVLAYAAFFLVAWLIFLGMQLPAAFALRFVQLPAGMSIDEPAGTVWSGQASIADRGGALGRVRWDLHALALLTGSLSADLRFDGPAGELQGRLSLSGGEIGVEGLALSLDVLEITSRPPALFPVRGRLVGTIQRARLAQSGITALEGELRLEGTGITFPLELSLGDFALDLATDGEVIRGDIGSGDAPLRAQGHLTISNGSQYQLNLTLTPAPGADPALRDALRLAGRARGDGSVTLVRRGDLRQWLRTR